MPTRMHATLSTDLSVSLPVCLSLSQSSCLYFCLALPIPLSRPIRETTRRLSPVPEIKTTAARDIAPLRPPPSGATRINVERCRAEIVLQKRAFLFPAGALPDGPR